MKCFRTSAYGARPDEASDISLPHTRLQSGEGHVGAMPTVSCTIYMPPALPGEWTLSSIASLLLAMSLDQGG